MSNALEKARAYVRKIYGEQSAAHATAYAQTAIAYSLIAIAERMPEPEDKE